MKLITYLNRINIVTIYWLIRTRFKSYSNMKVGYTLSQKQKNKKEFISISLTLVLLLAAIAVFLFVRGPNLNLWIPIRFYLLIDIGLLASLLIGVQSNNKSIKLFSILSNITFMIPISVWIYFLLLANGISEK